MIYSLKYKHILETSLLKLKAYSSFKNHLVCSFYTFETPIYLLLYQHTSLSDWGVI